MSCGRSAASTARSARSAGSRSSRAAAGAGTSRALGYPPHDGRALPAAPFLAHLSADISWCEMRVTQKARVHGFRAGNAFFLVFLDRNHEIFPG